jgi:hypothetical protein
LLSTDFVPQPTITLDTASTFINGGQLTSAALDVSQGPGKFIQVEGAQLVFRLSNFFTPNTLLLSDSVLNGSLTIDSTYFEYD